MGSHDTDNIDPQVPSLVETAYGLYPGLDSFSGEYDAQDYRDWVDQSNGDPLPAPLAVYIRDGGQGALNALRGKERANAGMPCAIEREIRLQGALFDSDRPVQQLICTGHIATAWTDDQLYALVDAVQGSFTLGQATGGWCACLATTDVPETRLRLLQVLGFLNIRVAVRQDNARDASEVHGKLEAIQELITVARRLGMRDVFIDLYFSETGPALAPGKLEAFANGTGAELFRLVEKSVPARSGNRACQRDGYAGVLASLGYQNIGLDWFARPGDMRARFGGAQQLHWSLLGFTGMVSPDVVGVGPGAVSTIGEFYSQNEHRWSAYQSLVEQDLIPVVRGLELESDDSLRREIMTMALTASRIDIGAIENKWGIQFEQFFSREIRQLYRLQKAGWVELHPDFVVVPVRGRRELEALCEIFDRRNRVLLTGSAPSYA